MTDRAALPRGDATPGGVRCSIGDYSINVLGPPKRGVGGPRRRRSDAPSRASRSTTPACSTDSTRCVKGSSRRRSSSTSTRRSAGWTSTRGLGANRIVGTATTFPRTPTAAARSTRRTTWTTSRSSISPDRIPAPHTTRTARSRSVPGSSASTGTSSNHVIWFGAVPVFGGLDYTDEGPARDGPLAARRRDGPPEHPARGEDRRPTVRTTSTTSARTSPASRSWNSRASDVSANCRSSRRGSARRGRSPATRSRPTRTSASSSRCVAPITTTCRCGSRKPSGQRLAKLFKGGVCDYAKPAVGQRDTVPWQTYQDARGNVVYGGRAMPAPLANSGAGWTSPSFSSWRRAG